jgi:hypothetical protein
LSGVGDSRSPSRPSPGFVGFDRDRAFYPTVLIVVASYYDLFAVLADRPRHCAPRSWSPWSSFAAAVADTNIRFWIVAAAMAGHGIMTFSIAA